MSRSIERFMWGWQPYFRMSLESAAESAFTKIGAESLQPVALLIGFARPGGSAAFDLCVEPEDGPVRPDALEGVVQAGEDAYLASDDANIFHTGEGMNEARHRQYRDRHRSEALCRALEGISTDPELIFFSGPSQPVGEYEVHPVLGVDRHAFESLPAIHTRVHSRMAMTRSLQHGVATALLEKASASLAMREPPSSLLAQSEDPATDAVAVAARRLVYSAATMSGNFLAHGLYDALRTLVTTPYEGRAGAGSVLLARVDHPAVSSTIRFSQATRLGAERQIRKLLQMATADESLLCDGDGLYGLGRLNDAYDESSEEVFKIVVLGRGAWELSHASSALMRVENGRPLLPKPKMSAERFTDTAKRLFSGIDDDSVARLWSIAVAAGEAAHGTMLVITDAAAAEVVRLLPQAIQIEPTYLTESTVALFTDIDGAVMLSPDGICHAGGAILDGTAGGKGDAGRGARYNSAVRYLQSTSANCMIVIVSEDGMIDVHPELQRRVSRAQVDDAVGVFLAAARSSTVNFEQVFKSREEVASLRFYLTEHQARAVNEATERVEDIRWNSSHMRVDHRPLAADPLMDDSYFID